MPGRAAWLTLDGVSVPGMITKKMETELLGLGYTPEKINAMTPQEAHETLRVLAAGPGGRRSDRGQAGATPRRSRL